MNELIPCCGVDDINTVLLKMLFDTFMNKLEFQNLWLLAPTFHQKYQYEFLFNLNIRQRLKSKKAGWINSE